MNAHLLSPGCDGARLLLLLINVAPQAELAPEHDGLGYVAALLASTVGAAANLVALVAYAGVGIERGLACLRLCAAHDIRGLLQGWIAAIGKREEILQLERGACRDLLQQFRRGRRMGRFARLRLAASACHGSRGRRLQAGCAARTAHRKSKSPPA